MDEKTKVKINQISEMILIYQSGIGEINQEEKKLIISDLNDKTRQLEQFKDEMEKELDQLYADGSNEIDESVNQLQSQIQKIEELQETIAGFLFDLNGVSEQSVNLQGEEIVEKSENEADNMFEDSEESLEENIESLDPLKEENISNIVEIDNNDFDEKNDYKIEEEQLDSIKKIENAIKEEDQFEQKITSPIEDSMEVNEEEIMKENNSFDNSVLNSNTSNENYKNIKISKKVQIKEISLNNQERKIAQKIVASRKNIIGTPINAVQRGNDAARLVMASINKSLGLIGLNKKEIIED